MMGPDVVCILQFIFAQFSTKVAPQQEDEFDIVNVQ